MRPEGYPIEIDWENPPTYGLTDYFWLDADATHNLVHPGRGEQVAYTGVTHGGQVGGFGALVDGSSDVMTLSPTVDHVGRNAGGGNMTVAFGVVITRTSGVRKIVTPISGHQIFLDGSDNLTVNMRGLNWVAPGDPITCPVGEMNHCALSYFGNPHADRTGSWARNGVVEFTEAGTGDGWSDMSIDEIGNDTAFSEWCGGVFYYFAFWNARALRNEEIAAFTADPYGILRPQRRAIYMPVAAAAGGFVPYPRYSMTGGMQPMRGI